MEKVFGYKLGDYVRYKGDYSIPGGVLRDPSYAIIEDIEMHFETLRVYLYLFEKETYIWCSFSDISPIRTNPKHLSTLGFQTINVQNALKYVLGDIVISGTQIILKNAIYLFSFCIADFTQAPLNLKKYTKEEELDVDLFLTDFLDVSNINDLFKFLERKGVELNRIEILNENSDR